jgi:hypothetical protein
MENTPDPYAIHTKFVDILEQHGAVLSVLELMRYGFIPRVAKQPTGGMRKVFRRFLPESS